MAEFVVLGPEDDTLFRSEIYDGDGISSYSGGAGYDTFNISAGTIGYIWFEPFYPYNLVQDPNVFAGYVEELEREVFVFAFVQSFEHIIAGSGSDIFYTTVNQTTLDGGLGNDTFYYSAFLGINDGDHYIGNIGNDILDFRDQTDPDRGFVFDDLRGEITDSSGSSPKVARFDGFENIYGTAGNDTIIPGLGTVVYNGASGNDLFDLDAGSFSSGATYLGSDGTDTLKFTSFTDGLTVDMEAGAMLFESSFVSIFAFIGDFEIVRAGRGDDVLIGQDGSQKLIGGRGADEIWGRAGADHLEGGRGNDSIHGEDGNDTVFGGYGEDTITGGEGDDDLSGGRNDDSIEGGAGSDKIVGGRGNDIMSGGTEADTFFFASNHGRDRITDFNPLEGDVIDLSKIARFSGFGDVLTRSTDISDDVVISTNGANEILLIGVSLSDLSADNFAF